ncbi:MAG: amidohydrolase family protein [Gammaproteobacteria bacterium]|nr:amidohydrolase family protein [Gammaproteobacteria bacterium]
MVFRHSYALTGAFVWLLMLLTACSENPQSGETGDPAVRDAVIYPAKNIITMASPGETAEALVVAKGRILDLGRLEDLMQRYPGVLVDSSFVDKVIVPGFIDPHMHVLLGGLLYSQAFAPPWPMATPAGMMPGFPTRESFIARLNEIVAQSPDDGSPIVVYGYHNLIQGDLDRHHLDAVTTTRPLVVWHYSAHDFYFNSAGLEAIGVTPELSQQYHGIDLDAEGNLSGRIYEDAALFVFQALQSTFFDPVKLGRGIKAYFDILRAAGVTTTADLGYGVLGRSNEDRTISAFWSLENSGFRLYLVPEFRAMAREFGEGAPQAVLDLVSGKLPAPAPVLPRVKFFADAAFYSQTMRLSAPGYLHGQSSGSEGLWVIAQGQIASTMQPYLEAGLGAHIHSNGDAAQSASLEALASLRSAGFTSDFVIEHGGLFSPAHISRTTELGAMVSVASHYVYYLSGQYAKALGPERAGWITPTGALSRNGTVVALHSDAPLAPPQPLRAAGAHITRLTREGTVYRPEQALTHYDALEAITLDSARVLGLQGEMGSIEKGKRADLTILYANPLETPGNQWADIRIWGVLLDGEKKPL